jgi:hypothetical protein
MSGQLLLLHSGPLLLQGVELLLGPSLLGLRPRLRQHDSHRPDQRHGQTTLSWKTWRPPVYRTPYGQAVRLTDRLAGRTRRAGATRRGFHRTRTPSETWVYLLHRARTISETGCTSSCHAGSRSRWGRVSAPSSLPRSASRNVGPRSRAQWENPPRKAPPRRRRPSGSA